MNRGIFFVAIGGLLGSVARYLVAITVSRQFASTFPYGTMGINITGCFLIGVFYALGEKGNILTPEWRLFLTTGICGGFTTFSTFSYESMNLLREGEWMYLSLYVLGSNIIGLGGTFLGTAIIKFI
jgi:fluoride exporter